MNTFTKVILAFVVIALPALSGNVYSHEKSDANSGLMMKANQQMMGMREQMLKNQSLMEQIRAEGNIENRSQLLQDHMKSMDKQMEMMNKLMGANRGDMSGVGMTEQMQMMQIMDTRMEMMQMLMKQMMEHQDQDQHQDN
jgi:hypothetical protein